MSDNTITEFSIVAVTKVRLNFMLHPQQLVRKKVWGMRGLSVIVLS